MYFKHLLSYLSVLCGRSQTAREIAIYPVWAEVADRDGMTWETFDIVSKDKTWVIPVFHITGTVDGGFYETDETKAPLLFQHGAFGDASGWLSSSHHYIFELANRGYDIWMFNQRGSRYTRRSDGFTVDQQEYWDWDQTDMVKYDLPPCIDKILSVRRD